MGRYDLRRKSEELLLNGPGKLHSQPQEALSLVGDAACLVLRGMEDEHSLWDFLDTQSPKEPLSDRIVAAAAIVGQIVEDLEEC